MNLSNAGLVAFHYRSYGAFFYPKIGSIRSIVDLPTTNIIEPIFLGEIGLTSTSASQVEVTEIFYTTKSDP